MTDEKEDKGAPSSEEPEEGVQGQESTTPDASEEAGVDEASDGSSESATDPDGTAPDRAVMRGGLALEHQARRSRGLARASA